ncbi:MAG TPA: response regulator transcription factor [Acidimicrobiia bacterium]|nr:response regulator transcription factor [Acidimicrobiia bacterium]
MTTGRIVVVEDDDAIGRGVVEALRLDGYAADRARTGPGALEAVADDGADLVVVDLDLGDGSAGELCRAMKQRSPAPSVLALLSNRPGARLAAGDVPDADDYVRKPFALADLRARVRLQLRPDLVARGRVVVGDLELDRVARRAWLRGRPIALRPKELDLLAFLLVHAGRAVPRRRLLDAVWGRAADAPSKTLDVHVSMLRRKLGDDAGTRIVTVRGIGYRYDALSATAEVS